ncbi:MAG: hypothetical protein M1482_05565 [Chloroflexi bacterium]|nr:hypothetical protein [Chloroflexota bacterium]
MLTCALAYSIVLTGPWAILRETAYAVGTASWWIYAAAFLAINLAVVPGIFLVCVLAAKKLGRANLSTRRFFVDHAYALVPLGLAAWAAFSLSFVTTNLSYAWPVVSDPFGWGWNLNGTANWPWTPYLAGWQSTLQVPILLVGLIGAIAVTVRTAREQRVPPLAALPIIGFCTLFTLAFVGLYV